MDLNKLINQASKDGKYHFFVLYCWALFPFNISKHFRVVVVSPGSISRLEVCHFKNKKHPKLGYIHKNIVKPGSGLKKYIWKTNKYRTPYLDYHISGKTNSLSHKIVSFVENNYHKYPQKDNYNIFIGPNCNSFVSWILNKFPNIDYKLPRNAIGKKIDYRI